MTFFEPFFQEIDTTLLTFVDTAAGNLAVYVNTAFTITATLMVVFLGLQLSHTPTELPVKKLLIMFATLTVVSALAGVPANYHDYISQYLMALPADFAAAVGGTGETQNVGGYLDQTIGRIGDGIALIMKQGGLTNLPPALIGALLFIGCVLLAAAATVAICIGKVGLALVVALGPIFIFCLLTPWTKDFFTRWLSYALQFAVLQALIAGTLLVAQVLIARYVLILAAPSWDFGDIVPILAPAIVMLVLTYLFGQLPSMASSLTGGIGLSMGNAAWSGVTMAAGAAGYAMGQGARAAGRGIAAAGNAGSDVTLGNGNAVKEGGDAQANNAVMRSTGQGQGKTTVAGAGGETDSAARVAAERAKPRLSGSQQAYARTMQEREMRNQNNERT